MIVSSFSRKQFRGEFAKTLKIHGLKFCHDRWLIRFFGRVLDCWSSQEYKITFYGHTVQHKRRSNRYVENTYKPSVSEMIIFVKALIKNLIENT